MVLLDVAKCASLARARSFECGLKTRRSHFQLFSFPHFSFPVSVLRPRFLRAFAASCKIQCRFDCRAPPHQGNPWSKSSWHLHSAGIQHRPAGQSLPIRHRSSSRCTSANHASKRAMDLRPHSKGGIKRVAPRACNAASMRDRTSCHWLRACSKPQIPNARD